MAENEVFKVWPEPKKGEKYGPFYPQNLVFNPPHTHDLDIPLYIGSSGAGKCLGIDTPVLMFDGTVKKVQDIEVGDLLMGPDSTSRRVKSLARGREKMYRISPIRGVGFTCNESHILSLKANSAPGVARGSVLNISVKDYLQKTPTFQKEWKLWRSGVINFEYRTTTLDPYYLGLWLGDGTASAPSVTTGDKEIADFLISYGESLGLKVRIVQGRGCQTFFLSSPNPAPGRNPVINQLKKYKVLNNKHIPLDFLHESEENRLQLLAGIVDSDGYANNKCVEICQRKINLGFDIAKLARSLGFYVSTKFVQKSCEYLGQRRENTYLKVMISGELDKIPTRLLRKQIEGRLSNKDVQVTRFTLEDLGPGDYYGFEIEGVDRLFLLEDFTVTHNTLCAVADGLAQALTNPGAELMVAAYDRKKLQKSAWKEWEERLSVGTGAWNHPLVLQKPTQYNGYKLILKSKNPKTGQIGVATVWFCYLKDWKAVMGLTLDWAHIEEAQQVQSEDAFFEIVRRMRGSVIKNKRIILTTNPEEIFGWIYNTFSLKQNSPNYHGERLSIGKPCTCHFCQKCRNNRLGDWLFVDSFGNPCTAEGSLCSNPACANINPSELKGPAHKENNCLGNQEFFRVIIAQTKDNVHNADTFTGNIVASMDETRAKIYAEGQIVQLRSGKVYSQFDVKNILPHNVDVDMDKDIIWTLDFNKRPQCSVILQEAGDRLTLKDEIVLWGCRKGDYEGAEADDVAEEFVRRYKGFKKDVHIYGDPAALYSGTTRHRTKFQILYDILTASGMNVLVHTQKIKGEMKPPVLERIDCVNWVCANNQLMVNPKCEFIIEALNQNIWDAKGTDIDDHCDVNAVNTMDKSKVLNMTHPTDALGYFLYKEYNIIVKNSDTNFVVLPKVLSSVQENGEITLTEYKESEDLPPPEDFPENLTPKATEEQAKSIYRVLEDRGYLFQSKNLKERLKFEELERQKLSKYKH